MGSSIYNHYDRNGEYTGSLVKCHSWMSPNFIGAIANPIAMIILFPLTPALTAWIVIGVLAYKHKINKLGIKLRKQKTNWNMIAWTIFMNILWIIWLFLYFLS